MTPSHARLFSPHIHHHTLATNLEKSITASILFFTTKRPCKDVAISSTYLLLIHSPTSVAISYQVYIPPLFSHFWVLVLGSRLQQAFIKQLIPPLQKASAALDNPDLPKLVHAGRGIGL
jgi:hypothetical protein